MPEVLVVNFSRANVRPTVTASSVYTIGLSDQPFSIARLKKKMWYPCIYMCVDTCTSMCADVCADMYTGLSDRPLGHRPCSLILLPMRRSCHDVQQAPKHATQVTMQRPHTAQNLLRTCHAQCNMLCSVPHAVRSAAVQHINNLFIAHQK